MEICKLCNRQFKSRKSLCSHLVLSHKYTKEQIIEYYDKYYKKEGEDVCKFCHNKAKFKNFVQGYFYYCNSDDCLSKSRASNTVESYMYKYNLSEKEANEKYMKRFNKNGELIKKSFDKILKSDPEFNKKRSHQTKEYWISRGYTEDEAIKKAQEVQKHINDITLKKRWEHPENYTNVNPTQIAYWIKHGYTENEAKNKVSERQRTFTLEKCIEKHGEEKGHKIWEKRQKNWSKKMKTMYKNGEYTKINQNLYSKPELELFETIISRINLTDVQYGKYQYVRTFRNIGKTYAYDFRYKNKIIEFNGDFWHCNPKNYVAEYHQPILNISANEIWNKDKLKQNLIKNCGFDILVIWESDYKNNKENIIQQCINFLNK